ncbi:MAG: aminotransferase class I/II-fold pyridoxal phosphate-dependent enzyme [Spirochaetaceae bacterium]|nr:MAG: aminotransferase class I/II-fold pyridoxal phosphate-dependent enzyme [Spirochaetaceae bacterium]
MNPLALELNQLLDGSVAGRMLSDFGRRLYFPKGIVAQSAEAGARAHKFNATVGMAVRNGEPMILPSLSAQLPGLTPREAVAYAPTAGVPQLRSLWLEAMKAKNPSLNAEAISLPVVTPGLTAGVAQAADMFCDEGDTIIVPDMFWGNYRLIFEERRLSKIRSFQFFSDEGGFNLEAFRKVVTEEAAHGQLRILLNFPNNPTGYSPTVHEAQEITNILVEQADKGADVLVLCDDAYFGLFYEEDTYGESLFAPLSQAHERILAIKLDGSTKEDFVWGFRVGFLSFGSAGLTAHHYDALLKKLAGGLRSAISNSSSVGQHLLIHLFTSPDYASEKQGCFLDLKKRYLRIRDIFQETPPPPCLETLPFNSGYFMSFRCRGIDAEQLRLSLLDEGIGTISIAGGYLRVAYSSVDLDQLLELYTAIFQAAEKLSATGS